MCGCFRVLSLKQGILFRGCAGALPSERPEELARGLLLIKRTSRRFSGMRALLNKIVTTNQEFESSFHRGSGVAQGNASGKLTLKFFGLLFSANYQ